MSRFIYVYREKSSGRAVYVGSAVDVEKRDNDHSTTASVPFDREIKRRGRDAFTLEVVEKIQGDSADRENHWMDVLETYNTPHGFNKARANHIEVTDAKNRVVIYVEQDVLDWLRSERARRNVSVSEIVRDALHCEMNPVPCDHCLAHPVNEHPLDKQKAEQ